MGFRVSMVTGPRHCGKSSVVSCIVSEIFADQPHYIRLASRDGSKKPRPDSAAPRADCGVASATWLDYDGDRVYEQLPASLDAIAARDRTAHVVIEADADPNLINAYPYDCIFFVLAAPESVHQIFRTPHEAREALRCVLHDTAAFAREIYGVFAEPYELRDGEHERRSQMSDSQIIRLLDTPLGEELATRIFLQPMYHGLLESDVVIINTRNDRNGVTGTVASKLGRLIRRTRRDRRSQPTVFCCNPCDPSDAQHSRLMSHLARLHDRPMRSRFRR